MEGSQEGFAGSAGWGKERNKAPAVAREETTKSKGTYAQGPREGLSGSKQGLGELLGDLK